MEGGIQLTTTQAADAYQLAGELTALLDNWALASAVQTLVVPMQGTQVALICNLRPEFRQHCMPGHDTLALHDRLGHSQNTDKAWALEREIWVALLGSPHRFQFANLASLTSHIRVRRNMALAARKPRWPSRPKRPNGLRPIGKMAVTMRASFSNPAAVWWMR